LRFPREQKVFLQAAKLLEQIKMDPDDLVCLFKLQKLLIRQIVKVETKTRRLKKVRHRLKSAKSSVGKRLNFTRELKRKKALEIKSLLESCTKRLNDYKQLLFLWRTFGDAIAGIYQSKYSLKHLFYDGEYNPKQDAGFLSGKEGFLLEYKSLVLGIKNGIPVLLCDLTNVVRHGDICLMGAEEPFLIELKSSKNQNARTQRQGEQLKKLGSFLATDEAKNFRGGLNTKRVPYRNKEVNYFDEINYCLTTAMKKGVCLIKPETGLSYISFTYQTFEEQKNKITKVLEEVVSQTSMMMTLTPTETSLPLQSYVLSFSAENGCHFIQEDLHVFAIIDIAEIKKQYKQLGVHAVALMDGIHAFQLCLDEGDLMKGVIRVNEQLFLRIACEFQSLSWFTEETAYQLNAIGDMQTDVDETTHGIFSKLSDDWLNPIDCLDI
tara:strand:+ start:127632 stop:128939 length:1308 start_codon:yes stop_codon:yes gene_type:complete